ncbi:hypothetical protein CPC16_010246, partial [Podila verticillata]
ASPAPMVRYVEGQREVLGFARLDSEEVTLPWRDKGVYLITGGLGGLGQVFARAIAQQVRHPVLVLTGRSTLKPAQERVLQELQTLGARVAYRAVDVIDAPAMAALVAEVVVQYGQLNGVIHSAGVLRDGLLVQKTGETVRQVLAPKVMGLMALDEATREVALDWLMLCSSVMGVWGNVGQTDYAMGNAFLDAYAQYRMNLVAQGQRQGRTVSISWPLWVEGGMQLDEAAQERLRRDTGLESLPSVAGVTALCQALAQNAAHLVVGYGTALHIVQQLRMAFEAPLSPAAERKLDTELSEVAADELQLRVEHALTGLISAQQKIAREELERDMPLREFGFDSITLTELGNLLNQKYGLTLSPTIFFEYLTIAALAAYLAQEYQALLAPAFATAVAVPVRSEAGSAPSSLTPSRRRQGRTAATLREDVSGGDTFKNEPIAVIGISGCFPQAEDIDALWTNLLSERDSIGALPAGRWNRGSTPTIPHAGVIENIDEFDPLFFGISPAEAQAMDPQQRLLMLYVYRVIEDAGYSVQSLSGSATALLVGTAGTGYGQLLTQAGETVVGYSAPGVWVSMGPNRMSYWLNWHGPSEPIDTACSSSLVAVHRALELIRSGQCTQAVVGGVNTLLSPEIHESFTQAGMLSQDGRCKTFSAQADGYVRGEGVGMLFLKPLSAAERDGDHIYGLIKGSATNHGGRANSLTAPNPRAQADLIKAALQQAGVGPETVGYIEAHGTGTPLGDPVEVQGFKSAFAELGVKSQMAYCGLGSVKSSIGHLELAAGVVGLIKVLLQLQHRTLVKSLHCEELNPLLALDGSPFYVVQQTRAWEALRDQQGHELPRRAGVSSFGFGGVNAHVIVEEYMNPQRVPAVFSGPVVVVLSARSETQLRDQVQQLLAYLERQAEVNLTDLAYTLQVGREALGVRLALVVNTVDELKERLSGYARGEAAQEGAYQGELKRSQEALALFRVDEGMQKAIEVWVAKSKLSKLAQLWVQGLELEWGQLYGEAKPQRMSLPTYPFAKERYWVPQTVVQGGPERQLHPLVHRNTSNLSEQRFSTMLTGEEFFLCDHVVRGQRVVPGAAQLEWARVAVTLASDDEGGTTELSVLLQEVTWLRPLVVTQPQEVHIRLERQENGRISFEIYSGRGDETVVYSQGWAQLAAVGEAPQVDLEAVRGQCEQTLAGEACYARFVQLGLGYGPSFQVLHELRVGHNVALGTLRLPSENPVGYEWAPNLLDAALQSSVGLTQDETNAPLALPFAVAQVKQWGEIPTPAWAVVRPSAGDSPAIRKLDVDIVGASGQVALRLSGFCVRPVHEVAGHAVAIPETVLLAPQWTVQPASAQPTAVSVRVHRILLCEVGKDGPEKSAELAAELSAAQCVQLTETGSLAQRYTAYALQLLARIQQEVAAYPSEALLFQLVVPSEGEGTIMQGLSGLLRSAQQEYPRLACQVVAVEAGVSMPVLAQRLRVEAASPVPVVRYVQGQREVLSYARLASEEPTLPWRDEGVYLITGGLGGLGQVFARAMAQQVRHPVLVLTGRSALKPAQELVLQELQALGARVAYRLVDVSDVAAVSALVVEIEAQYGPLNGVIHSAGVLRDSLLAQKSGGSLQQVLAPKVAGLMALDEATQDMALDWLIVCSSVASVFGNVGQTDYAAGNGFLDSYAQYRSGLVAQGQRQGRTVSVSWPLWAEGGMQLDAAAQERLRRDTGLEPLPSAAGVTILYQALAQNTAHVVVGYGAAARILNQLRVACEAPLSFAAEVVVDTELSEFAGDELQSRVEYALTGLISAQLKIAREELERDTPLSEFGFESITLTEFGNALHQKYGLALSPTIFFEYSTIAALAGYLLREHRAVLAPAFAATVKTPIRFAGGAVPVPLPPTTRRRRGGVATAPLQVEVSRRDPLKNEPIAVIGMSGCFPQAEDINALWANLLSEQDSIGALPASRWHRGLAPSICHAGVIENIDEFDPLFFGISPREAQAMDPQQRLLMLYVYRAIEDAGYSVQSLSGSDTALLVGTMSSGYGQLLAQAGETVAGYSAAGVVGSMGPNRMSYWLNWHGPSEPIETACSSSLVAVHRALELLRSGQCARAVVGGVNTLLSLEVHESFTQAGMLSQDGRCKTFSAQADGYVRGEGVGMLFLKPLSAAERDGDHIYGLIKGSATNHGGRANSLTAPNPRAQADLIKAALQQAGVEPETVSYIEAHGTGTSLGDPIEAQGLKSAFAELGAGLPVAYCGLGSVKSNLGHLELAAGVVGLIKVLLQLQHQTLVKSLHCEELNPLLALSDSPFYVVQQACAWEALRDRQGQVLPRRAGVSSFGFGGVNAHVIVEEYVAPQKAPTVVSGPVVVLLSARSEERLRDQAQQLLAYLERQAEVNLADLAYTLQVGREALGVRLALLTTSMSTLKEQLSRYVRGEAAQEETFHGEAKREHDTLAVFRADEEFQEVISKWMALGKVGKLAQLWVQGLEVKWAQLYGAVKPQRISLPTYPFAKERYWVSQGLERATVTGAEFLLHPLIHRNTSDLIEQRYSTTLTGEEWFLRDHVVRGERIVPGAVQLEWARAAVALASRMDAEQTVILETVAWLRPLKVLDVLEVHISLEVQEDGQIAFEMYSGNDDETVVYSRGTAQLAEVRDAPRLNLAALLGQCSQTLTSAVCYARFAHLGLEYGASFQVLSALQVGPNVVVGSLRLPGKAAGGYTWLPQLLDGALQTSLGLTQDESLALSFAVEQVRQWGEVPTEAWAVVRPREGESATMHTLDIDIADASGIVALRLSGCSIRIVQDSLERAIAVPQTVIKAPLAPSVALPPATESVLPPVTQHDLMDLDARLAQLLQAQLDSVGGFAANAQPSAPYARWWQHSRRLLAERGLPMQAAPDPSVLWAQWDAYRDAVQNDPALSAQIRLVDAALRALPSVLRGDTLATEVLFPQGQLALVEGVYHDHPVADYFNTVLAECLMTYVQARRQTDPMTPYRILEIGAGTGGTSMTLFKQLAPYALQIEEYAYTDVSPAFLLHAQEHYVAQAPYLRTQRLDIERSPLEQGFELGRYDVVLATNVLHATRDIRRTVRHAKALLKDNGLLLLNELTNTGLFAHLTFGLLDGWWLAEDQELRITGTPALAPSTWRQVLEAEGFGALQFPAEAAHDLGQQIVVAVSDGQVQPQRSEVSLTSAHAPIRTVSQATMPQTMLLAPRWKAQTLIPSADLPTYAVHGVLLCEVGTRDASIVEVFTATLPLAQCERLMATGMLAERYVCYAQKVVAWLQRQVATHAGASLFLQLVTPNADEGAVLQGLSGLLRSAQQEYPQLVAQIVAVDVDAPALVLAQWLQAEAAAPTPMVRYAQGRREVWDFEDLDTTNTVETVLPWRARGVYLITGGLGGLGQIFARASAQVCDPVLILAGRSVLQPAYEEVLEALRALGARVVYRALDVGDAVAVAALIADIVAEYGTLNGVIHSAGVLRDGLLATKTAQALQEVLIPKVDGLVALDEATRDIDLDWLVLCSSLVTVLGNVGVTDYAAGNGFLDAYAQYREGLVRQGLRHGRTLSVGWPLWADGGMQLDTATQERMRQMMGMEALPSEAGVSVLYRALHQAAAHVVVGYGDRTRMLQHVRTGYAASMSARPKKTAVIDFELSKIVSNELQLRVEHALTELIAVQLKIAREELKRDTPLSEFGFDSILLSGFSSVLNRTYGLKLSPTVFFEYRTIAALAEYLTREQAAVMAKSLAAMVDVQADAGERAVLVAPASWRGRKRLPLASSMTAVAPAVPSRTSQTTVPTAHISLDPELAKVGSIRSLNERQRLFAGELERLDKRLCPINIGGLSEALAPYASKFKVVEDLAGDLWIFIQTGPGNTFDLASLKALLGIFTAIRDFADFSRTRFIYFSHRGKHFSLGGDRKSFLDGIQRSDTDAIIELGETYKSLLDTLAVLPCLIVGAVYGSAQGGGMEFLMMTDLQFVWPGLKMGLPESRSGLIAGMGGMSYLSSVIGPVRALRLNVMGELISSETAVSYGLISHLSESPFFDALALRDADFDLDAAIAARKVITGSKYEILKKDLDWGAVPADLSLQPA